MRPRSRHLQQRFFNTSCIKNRYKLKRKFYRRCFSENIWCPEKSRMPKNLSCHLKSGDLGQKYFCSFSVLFCLEKPRFIAIKILLWGWNSFLNRLVLRLVKWKVFDLRKKNFFREGIWNYGISIENDYSPTMPLKSSICFMRMKKKAVSHTKNCVQKYFLRSRCHTSCIHWCVFKRNFHESKKKKTLTCSKMGQSQRDTTWFKISLSNFFNRTWQSMSGITQWPQKVILCRIFS